MTPEQLALSRKVSRLPGAPGHPYHLLFQEGGDCVDSDGCRWVPDPEDPGVWLLDLGHKGTGGVLWVALGTEAYRVGWHPDGWLAMLGADDDAVATIYGTPAEACARVALALGRFPGGVG